MVWYGMVYVNLYSAIVANDSNALGTLVTRKQPSFQAMFEKSKVLQLFHFGQNVSAF